MAASRSLRGVAIGAMIWRPSMVDQQLVFFRCAAALLAAGISLMDALTVASEECGRGPFHEALEGIAAELENGSTLHEAMSRRPREFGATTCALVRAGESTGSLDGAFERAAFLLEKSRALRRRVTAAVSYPLIVSVIAAGLSVVLVVAVMPTVTSMYAQSGTALPTATRLLLAISAWCALPWHWLVLMLSALGLGAIGHHAVRIRGVRSRLERVVFGVPFLGALFKKAEVAGCARVLSVLIEGGIPIERVMDIAMAAARTLTQREALASVTQTVSLGQSLADAFSAAGWYPATFIALLRAGERSGTVDTMLARVAEYGEAEVDLGVAVLGNAVEPVLILVLGAVVATIVAAIVMPLYSLIGNIR
jgi:type IV pilus assembly protein PilC